MYYRSLLLGLLLLGFRVEAQQATDKPSPYDSAHFDLFHPVPRNRLRPLRPARGEDQGQGLLHVRH